jgi:hypothetical protein
VVAVGGKFVPRGLTPVTVGVGVAAIVIIGAAIWYSRRGESYGRDYGDTEVPAVRETNPVIEASPEVIPGLGIGAAPLETAEMNLEDDREGIPAGEKRWNLKLF